ncbi:MAG TPA: hypothetical protein VIQ77_08455 [Mucilaginibacter sp.]|jgi:hypothetical protein
MTFEEFFKKKRIDLAAFQQGEPTLFAEFKLHFEQMGEKSFDHTKKYWFNKLRGEYHLAPEVKTEKPQAENQLAEQTVAEELSELTAIVPQIDVDPDVNAPAAPVTEKPKVGFTPRFKAGVTKPVETPAGATPNEKKEETPTTEDKPKIGFTPRFKAGVTKSAETPSEEKPAEGKTSEEKPKIGFTPRFKAGVTKTADTASEPKMEESVPSEVKPVENKPSEEKPKTGFTPRFKAGVTKAITSPGEQSKTEEPAAAEEKPAEEKQPEAKPKMGFTPRFKAGITKQAPPSSEE